MSSPNAQSRPDGYRFSDVRRYYVAGGMMGVHEHNFPAFDAATKMLRDRGYEVFNPAEHERSQGFVCDGMNGEEADALFPGDLSNIDRRRGMATDANFICLEATHIYMLDGWSLSKEATAERFLAIAVGVVVEGYPN